MGNSEELGRFTLNLVPKRKAVFLDRDGTINVEKNYLYRIEDFEFIDGAPGAIKRLREGGYLIVVVTNQSGVARGYYTLEDVDRLHRYIQRELSEFGTAIDAFYTCPHHPTSGLGELRQECDCRKGRPGMLLQAAAEHHIDLAGSFIIGDKCADIEAGRRAGCAPLMVLTGYGSREAPKLSKDPVPLFADLNEAADFILSGKGT
jgi:D-glycero-D-manno-heptose 1,7-bisphosphate phosphatase